MNQKLNTLPEMEGKVVASASIAQDTSRRYCPQTLTIKFTDGTEIHILSRVQVFHGDDNERRVVDVKVV